MSIVGVLTTTITSILGTVAVPMTCLVFIVRLRQLESSAFFSDFSCIWFMHDNVFIDFSSNILKIFL